MHAMPAWTEPADLLFMSKSVRVLVLNNYALDAVWEEVNRGEKPDHQL